MAWFSFPSPLGDITVFEDDNTVIALEWGDVEGGSETPFLQNVRDQLDAYFDGERQDFTLPLAPQGTAFQMKVWDALRSIPYGQTRSYGDLAQELGTSARAIGLACGRNPLPLLIPCHRVLGSKGQLGGYSGPDGVDGKRNLLILEGVLPADPVS